MSYFRAHSKAEPRSPVLEVEINEVTFNPSSKSYMVILRQKDADRWLRISQDGEETITWRTS